MSVFTSIADLGQPNPIWGGALATWPLSPMRRSSRPAGGIQSSLARGSLTHIVALQPRRSPYLAGFRGSYFELGFCVWRVGGFLPQAAAFHPPPSNGYGWSRAASVLRCRLPNV